MTEVGRIGNMNTGHHNYITSGHQHLQINNLGSYNYDISGHYNSNPQLTGHTRSNDCRLQPRSHSRKTTRGFIQHPRNMDTPTIHTQMIPKRLFNKENDPSSINMGMEEINVEFLLLNTLIINAVKVQTVLENFIKGKEYTSIFCFTEIKVDSLDFNPVGIKIFSKHRKNNEKK